MDADLDLFDQDGDILLTEDGDELLLDGVCCIVNREAETPCEFTPQAEPECRLNCCPLPRNISALLPGGVTMWSTNCRVGPFLLTPNSGCDLSTRFCGIFREPDEKKTLQAWVSDDMGFSWAVVDGSGFTELANIIDSHDAVQDGDRIRVATKESSTGLVKYHVFNLSTETWESTGEAVNGDGSDADVTKNGHVVAICVRSGGDIAIAYSSDKEFDGDYRDRCLMRVRSAGVWSSAINIGIHGSPYINPPHNNRGTGICRLIPGQANRIHVLMSESPGQFASATDDVIQTVAGDNTLGPLNLWATHGISGGFTYGRPFVYPDRSKFVMPMRNAPDLKYFVFSDSTDVTTFDTSATPGQDIQYGGFGSGLATVIAGVPESAVRIAAMDWTFSASDLWVRLDASTKVSPYVNGANNLQEMDGQILSLEGGVWLFYFVGNFAGDGVFFFLQDIANLGSIASLTIGAWEAALASQGSAFEEDCTDVDSRIPEPACAFTPVADC